MKSMTHQFLDFAAGKPREEGYPGMDRINCAVAQFMKSIGLDPKPPWPPQFRQLDSHAIKLPCTFGALADRLRASLGPSA